MSSILRPASPTNDERLYPASYVRTPILYDTLLPLLDSIPEKLLFLNLEDTILNIQDSPVKQLIYNRFSSINISDTVQLSVIRTVIFFDSIERLTDQQYLVTFKVYGDAVYTADEIKKALAKIIDNGIVLLSDQISRRGLERVSVFAFTDIKNSIGFVMGVKGN